MTAAVAPLPVEAPTLRAVLGRFATGVALVTAGGTGRAEGLVVNSLTSVSLEPPLLAFCAGRTSRTWRRMRRAGRFGVNVLGHEDAGWARAAAAPGADRLGSAPFSRTPAGVPELERAIAFLECRIAAEHPVGDHWLVLGAIEGLAVRGPAADPLVFFDGEFGTFERS